MVGKGHGWAEDGFAFLVGVEFSEVFDGVTYPISGSRTKWQASILWFYFYDFTLQTRAQSEPTTPARPSDHLASSSHQYQSSFLYALYSDPDDG